MKLFKFSTYLFASALLLFGCGKSSDTVETRDAAEVAAGSGTKVSIDQNASSVNWRGYKPTGQHYGIIPISSGELTVEGNNVTAGTITFDITKLEVHDLEAGSDNHGKLWGHLQSEDFFDASNHPQAKFEITEVQPFASGNIADKEEFKTDNTPKSDSELAPSNPTHWVSGNLTLRGTTKNIKFPANISVNGGKVQAKAGFNINRTDWGLSYGDEASAADKAKDQFIYNSVSLDFDVKSN